jgi:hypothetical protein
MMVKVLEIALPVLEVGFLVGDVPVAADDDLAAAADQRGQVAVEMLHEVILGRLPVVTAGARGQIDRHHGQLGIDQFDIAAFGVDLGHAQADHHRLRLVRGIDAHTAIAFFLGVMEIALVGARRLHGRGDVRFLGLELLDADEIGVLLAHPIEKTLGVGGPDAIQVGGNDSQHRDSRSRWRRKVAMGLNYNEITRIRGRDATK